VAFPSKIVLKGSVLNEEKNGIVHICNLSLPLEADKNRDMGGKWKCKSFKI